ncbi:MBL fold metallo-hydrolase [Tessaracoccus sp. MC1865]|uniref:MBL fold metallo-hydrolase n=1 Tax=Tessaracoccus sp. MC1865 TaxID=2760310 RepID=UPI0016025D69|nr:MBL fold metallo-hydrolase [Tessaracoccus sp. MC1865]MBB1482982.1 MBL fold metallo-hydrolase [Tessaracoccus sp. MC1865]QTO37581.1 MBL fold metallo-hydrolase [Tessaracoccus sp. MC1865]
MSARVEHLVTASGQGFENNVWLVGDDTEAIIIDPAHDASAVVELVGGRRVTQIVLTHGHWDHIGAVLDLAPLVGSPPIRLHEADRFLWDEEHPGDDFNPLLDGEHLAVAGTELEVRHTPGHTPGAVSLVAEDLGCVFTGDTLFEGGPGATRWGYSGFEQIIGSISERLFTLPDETVVHTGHGPSTTIGAERPQLADWVARGW